MAVTASSILAFGICLATGCTPPVNPSSEGFAAASQSESRPPSARDGYSINRGELLGLQQRLIKGEASPREILELVVDLLEYYGPETPRREISGQDEVWRRFELVKDEQFGTITLSVLCAGLAEEPRKVIMLIRENQASYLPEGISAVDSEFRINLGLDSKRIVYCATSLHARIAPTAELVARLKSHSSSICIGATQEVRDGNDEWAEIRLELGTLDGKPTTTSRIVSMRTRKAAELGDSPEVIHLGEVLTALAEN